MLKFIDSLHLAERDISVYVCMKMHVYIYVHVGYLYIDKLGHIWMFFHQLWEVFKKRLKWIKSWTNPICSHRQNKCDWGRKPFVIPRLQGIQISVQFFPVTLPNVLLDKSLANLLLLTKFPMHGTEDGVSHPGAHQSHWGHLTRQTNTAQAHWIRPRWKILGWIEVKMVDERIRIKPTY